MATIQSNIPFGHNGDQVIRTVKAKDVKGIQGFMDLPTMSQFMEDDPIKYHLGMQQFFGNQNAYVTEGIFPQLLKNKAVLEVNGVDGSFTYDIPVEEVSGCYTTRDMSHQKNAGIDGAKFKITLSEKFTTGDTLTNDAMSDSGQQIFVTDDEVVQVGDGFEHTVKLQSTDRGEWFAASNLAKGISYFKLGHNLQGEYATGFSNINLPKTVGKLTCEFTLGNMVAVEAAYTGRADMKNFSGAGASTKEYLGKLQEEVDRMGEIAIWAKEDKNKRMIKGTASIAPTLEILVQRETSRLFAQQLMFQKPYVGNEGKGVFRLNEGLWHQLRRGYLIKYSRPGGITRTHIKEAVEYVFRNNPMKQDVDRWVEFKCGYEAYQNVLEIFSDEINNQLDNIGRFMGSDRQLPKNPVSGNDLMELGLEPIRFTKVFIPGIGKLKIKHDSTLDVGMMEDRLSAGFHREGKSWTTYSMVIWDAMDSQYSNNKELPKGTRLVEGGNANSNVYLVKPEGAMSWSGTEQGRYSPYKTSEIVSSLKYIGGSFWNFKVGAIFVKDVSRFVMIELDQRARKGFN